MYTCNRSRPRRPTDRCIGTFHDRMGYALRRLRADNQGAYDSICDGTKQILWKLAMDHGSSYYPERVVLRLDNLIPACAADFTHEPPGLKLLSIPHVTTADAWCDEECVATEGATLNDVELVCQGNQASHALGIAGQVSQEYEELQLDADAAFMNVTIPKVRAFLLFLRSIQASASIRRATR